MARALRIPGTLLRSIALLPDLEDKLFFPNDAALMGPLTPGPPHKQIQIHFKLHAVSWPCSICQRAASAFQSLGAVT